MVCVFGEFRLNLFRRACFRFDGHRLKEKKTKFQFGLFQAKYTEKHDMIHLSDLLSCQRFWFNSQSKLKYIQLMQLNQKPRKLSQQQQAMIRSINVLLFISPKFFHSGSGQFNEFA